MKCILKPSCIELVTIFGMLIHSGCSVVYKSMHIPNSGKLLKSCILNISKTLDSFEINFQTLKLKWCYRYVCTSNYR